MSPHACAIPVADPEWAIMVASQVKSQPHADYAEGEADIRAKKIFVRNTLFFLLIIAIVATVALVLVTVPPVKSQRSGDTPDLTTHHIDSRRIEGRMADSRTMTNKDHVMTKTALPVIRPDQEDDESLKPR